MSDTIKLIIDIPKDYYEIIKHDVDNHLTDYRPFEIIANGTPLNNISEQAEVQTYLAGHIKGWEQGREDLIDEILNKVSEIPTCERDGCCVKNDVYRVLEEIIEKEK